MLKMKLQVSSLNKSLFIYIVLEELPIVEAPGHRSVFIGDPKLSDFKQVLMNAGYHAELYGGVLWTCEGMIALKKEEVDGQPRIKLDGVLCDDYFKIRDLLYSQYTIL